MRKKLKLPKSKKIILFTGRISYEKCSDILKELIEANPDILFILIGKIIDKRYMQIRTKNYRHIEKKSSEELVDYYSAADLCFCLHRVKHGGLGLTTEESLACGVPALSPFRPEIKGSNALFQMLVEFEDANKKICWFFNLSENERNKLSIEARKYAEKYYSGHASKEKYIKYYLN